MLLFERLCRYVKVWQTLSSEMHPSGLGTPAQSDINLTNNAARFPPLTELQLAPVLSVSEGHSLTRMNYSVRINAALTATH